MWATFFSNRHPQVLQGAAEHVLEVERLVYHAERPGFRIAELHLSADQKVPWHYHTNVQDTFYVLQGRLRVFMQDPKEDVRLEPGETYAVAPHHRR